jgi:hypothetical protein
VKEEPTMVTQEEIDRVWQNANFGDMARVDVVKYGLLKAAGGWYQGHTSTCILVELGLIKRTKKGNKLTLRGQRNLYNYFKDVNKNI